MLTFYVKSFPLFTFSKTRKILNALVKRKHRVGLKHLYFLGHLCVWLKRTCIALLFVNYFQSHAYYNCRIFSLVFSFCVPMASLNTVQTLWWWYRKSLFWPYSPALSIFKRLCQYLSIISALIGRKRLLIYALEIVKGAFLHIFLGRGVCSIFKKRQQRFLFSCIQISWLCRFSLVLLASTFFSHRKQQILSCKQYSCLFPDPLSQFIPFQQLSRLGMRVCQPWLPTSAITLILIASTFQQAGLLCRCSSWHGVFNPKCVLSYTFLVRFIFSLALLDKSMSCYRFSQIGLLLTI